MNNSVFHFDVPGNEPILNYEPGSLQRDHLKDELERQASNVIEIPLIINGKEIHTGKTADFVMPDDHSHVIAKYHIAGEKEVEMAINAALIARDNWRDLSWIERASIQLKAAELISNKYRYVINASTMLGQGKNAFQAEIDAACETIDYLRYNVYFASKIYSEQPISQFDQLNRMEYRPLEGFVFALSPFNFTAIASNLNMSVALMGNTTVWKPSSTSILSNYYLMKIFLEAGLPPGVVNFIPGSGKLIGKQVFKHNLFAGLHFTGSNNTFNHVWRQISEQLESYRSYPRIVGETGGKDFIFVHSSAEPLSVATAIVRGAFEYQGQKCSAASRAYIPKSLWKQIKDYLCDMTGSMKVGDVRDFSNFMNAVIDESAFDKIMRYIDLAKNSSDIDIISGASGDKSKGFFIQPTILKTENPRFITMEQEIFGPVMTIFVYDDDKYTETLHLCDDTSPYALTGAIFSNDRYAYIEACRILRYAAGNFYINDKPTGAMVGLQPFGGSRASGTNDKAGGPLNLLRWVNPRTIKETFIPSTQYEYPFMKEP